MSRVKVGCKSSLAHTLESTLDLKSLPLEVEMMLGVRRFLDEHDGTTSCFDDLDID
jgi:hypothetical protein